MVINLPTVEKKEIDETKWHLVWCLRPRIIKNNFVWLSKVERRLVSMSERYDGIAPYTVKKYEYRLPMWVQY